MKKKKAEKLISQAVIYAARAYKLGADDLQKILENIIQELG